MRKIERIILHCTATPEGKHISVDTIRNWHLKRNFKDIGYHYIIYLNGKIKKGRPDKEIGAHVKGKNRTSIGIAYVGGIDSEGKPKDTMRPLQEIAMVNLLQALKQAYPDATIHGHNEFSNKACPSFDVQDKYGWIE